MDRTLSEQYRRLATETADKLWRLPQARYVLLIGSVADGTADATSDIDLMVLHRSEPSEDEIAACLDRPSTRKFWHGEHHFDASYKVDGAPRSLMFTSAGRIEGFVERYPDLSFDEYGELSRYIVSGERLYGDSEEFASWQSKCRKVPVEMKKSAIPSAMASLNFYFRQGNLHRLAERADWIMVNRTLNGSILGILKVIYLLNDKMMIYPKRTRVELQTYRVKPQGIASRLEDLYLLQNTVADMEAKIAQVIQIMDELELLIQEDPDLGSANRSKGA